MSSDQDFLILAIFELIAEHLTIQHTYFPTHILSIAEHTDTPTVQYVTTNKMKD